MKALKTVIFIVGPTAVGKTDIAFSLAEKNQGEIISCDAMQVYRGVDIASNKPPATYLKKIPHHLINILSVEQNFDVSQFERLAREAIRAVHARGHLPIVTGGSGLYMQILLDGIFPSQKRDMLLRDKLFQDAQQYGRQYLHDQLRQRDPVSAQKIHPNDLKKMIRALEVCIQEERPLSELQKQRQGIWGEYPIRLYCIHQPRPLLYEKIEQRVDRMFDLGLIDEIKSLQKKRLSQGARSIIGVKEVMGYLDGEYEKAQARYLMKLHTRRLAKRQLTWFRKDQRLQWLSLSESTKKETIVENIRRENNL
jgi:tRNA dimethylallyltransferase